MREFCAPKQLFVETLKWSWCLRVEILPGPYLSESVEVGPGKRGGRTAEDRDRAGSDGHELIVGSFGQRSNALPPVRHSDSETLKPGPELPA